MRCGWTIADVREGFHAVWLDYCRRAREFSWGLASRGIILRKEALYSCAWRLALLHDMRLCDRLYAQLLCGMHAYSVWDSNLAQP